jgi:hypothetical protein
VQHVEVLGEGGRARVGLRDGDRVAKRVVAEQAAVGGGQARIDARDRAPVGLVAAMRRAVGRGLGEREQGVGGRDQADAERELRAEDVQLVEQ